MKPPLFGRPVQMPGYHPSLQPLPGEKFVRGSATSKKAWLAIEPSRASLRGRVLNLLREYRNGLTDHEMQAALAMNPSTQRPRRVELVEGEFVVDSGHYRPSPSGCMATVWKAVR
jgi:hypothetical protein